MLISSQELSIVLTAFVLTLFNLAKSAFEGDAAPKVPRTFVNSELSFPTCSSIYISGSGSVSVVLLPYIFEKNNISPYDGNLTSQVCRI
jgi:hypothetical protein